MAEHTLNENEPHPAAELARVWFNEWKKKNPERYIMVRESIASSSLSGNRMAEICNSTLNRIENGQQISDRYLLGLCWFLQAYFNND